MLLVFKTSPQNVCNASCKINESVMLKSFLSTLNKILTTYCICTCIVSLTAQVRLVCSWCMSICLRRAAHINAERLVDSGFSPKGIYATGKDYKLLE